MSARSLVLLLSLALLGGLAAACSDDTRPDGDCPATCPCAEAGCADGWCGVLLTLDPSCAAESPAVEVVAAGCPEADDVVVTAGGPAVTRVPCGAIAAGATGLVVARGEGVQWGPFEISCPEGGGLLYPVSLECPAP